MIRLKLTSVRFLYIYLFFLLVTTSLIAAGKSATSFWVPKIFGDNMVLQQNRKIPVWGTDVAGGPITLQLGQLEKRTRVGKNGQWRIELPAQTAGGPYDLRIMGSDSLHFKNIMIGEVWIGSGQSNMEWPVARSHAATQEIQAADFTNIRLFTVTHQPAIVPLRDVVTAGWQICNPTTIANFSAVAYFFGRELHRQLNVPIGLVLSAWGGTPAEAWTSKQGLQPLTNFAPALAQLPVSGHPDSLQKKYAHWMANWDKFFNVWIDSVLQLDAGLAKAQPRWCDPDFNFSTGSVMSLPGYWEFGSLGNLDGVVWFRRTINLPADWQGKDLTLSLGTIDDVDQTWFNGFLIGKTQAAGLQRRYPVPAAQVRSGENVIAIQVLDYGGNGGFSGKPHQLFLCSNDDDTLSLAGDWHYQIGVDSQGLPLNPVPPARPSHQPTSLYNGMVAPLIPYAFQGVIWYQGESNASRAFQYRQLFPALIQDWRRHWQQGNFPFLFVQLANYMETKPEPGESDWAELREAQLMTLALPHTGMAVTIDIGDAKDIHPKNKQELGRRLALNALNKVYNKEEIFSGPVYESMKIEGHQIRVKFRYVAGGLKTSKNEPVQGFAIAGADRKFYWADARLEGETVVVSHAQVPQPFAVRYAWANNPRANLYNQAGLPASPFRTDNWPGITTPRSVPRFSRK